MELFKNFDNEKEIADSRYDKFHRFFCAFHLKNRDETVNETDNIKKEYLNSPNLKAIYEKELFKTLNEDKNIRTFLDTYNLNISYLKNIYHVIVDSGGEYVVKDKWLPIIIITNPSYLSYIKNYIEENELNEMIQIKNKITMVVGSCLMNISNGRKLN